MKKIFSLFLISLIVQSVWSQSGEDYNPQNPADPDVYYSLTLEASPRSGGTVSPSSRQSLAAGGSCYVSASPRLGYEFKRWMVGDQEVSTERSFSYTMPESNVVLTAYFEWNPSYDPDSPSDPDAEGYSHKVNVYAQPSAGGYFNSSSFWLIEGETTRIYAYPREGYRFESWMVDGKVVSTDNPLNIRMLTENMAYTANFVYNPVSPDEPSPNVFNAATGEVIIDHFTPGSLNQAIYRVVGSDNYSLVQSITVIGRMSSSDFGFAYNYRNCSQIDLSRTTGYTEVPNWAFEGAEALKQINLPLNVENIGNNAFNGCSNLTDIYIYATTPPVCAENAMSGLSKSVKVHVPTSAVPLYRVAEGWRNLTVQSLDQNEKSITVNLPEESGKYKNMTLELQNIQSGQIYRYLITDHTVYTFYSLVKNTTYNLYLKTGTGAVLSELTNVMLTDKDLDVSFSSIKTMHDVSLVVQTPDGKNVTSDVTITWLDTQGNYIRQGNGVSDILTGTSIQYQMKLSKDLAMEYTQPSDAVYIVKEGNNDVVCTLSPIKQITMSGYVKDAVTKQGVYGATVSISQTLNGKYSKTIIARTDNDGRYSATVYNAPTQLAISAFDYVNQTAEVDIEPSSASVVVNDISLTSIVGATINVSLTYTPSVAEGETAETQNWYNDYQNVTYSIYNMTTGKEVTQVSVRYPQLVILDGVKVGDRLKVTARSKKDAFISVVTEAYVDSTNYLNVSFPILAYGGIEASFNSSPNSHVVGVLYDGNGYLVKAYDYNSEANLSIPNVKDGDYTLITMGKDTYFNSIYSLSQLPSVGLVEGMDYCKNFITVKSGVIKQINNGVIPKLDTTKYKYIGENTSFTVNKPSIVVGNYLTFNCNVDFFGEYVSAISNVELIVDIPETASFVEKSLLIGSSTAEYILQNNRMIIPLANYHHADKVRFCVIPKEKGVYAPSAFVRFRVDDDEKMVAIGAANYTVESLNINVPKTTANKSIMIRGVAQPGSTVQIYDSDVVIGQIETPATGIWNVECELVNAYNLSTHSIFAEVTTGGISVLSETQDCYYNKDTNGVRTVAMTHYNAYYKKNMDVLFDIENGTTIPNSYYFYQPADFSFIVDFINNDTTAVSDVYVSAIDNKNKATKMSASYDKRLNKWVATHRFSSGDAPVNVSVSYTTPNATFEIDGDKLNSIYDNLSKENIAYTSELERINSICLAIEGLIKESENSFETSILDSLIYSITNNSVDAIDENETVWDDLELEEIVNLCKNEIQECDSLINSIEVFYDDFDSAYINGSLDSKIVFDGLNDTFTRVESDCTGLTVESLINLGYVRIPTTNDIELYICMSEDICDYVDLSHNVRISLFSRELQAPTKEFRPRHAPSWYSLLADMSRTLVLKATKNRDVLNSIYIEFVKRREKDFLELNLKERNINWRIKVLDRQISQASGFERKMLETQRLSFSNSLTDIERQRAKLMRLPTNIARINLAITTITDWIKWCNRVLNYADQIGALQLEDCAWTVNPAACQLVSEKIENLQNDFVSYFKWQFARKLFYNIANMATKRFIIGFVLEILEHQAESIRDEQFDSDVRNRLYMYSKAVSDINKQCKEDEEEDSEGDGEPVTKLEDPSGYVYEGVSSNRLQGVTATAYYMETTEDMYGVLHDEPKVWDAEEYAQENPLFTDENGMYQWDVPQGLWQVKFEKEGYETTYSEWLPVPPPQLDVNIAMAQVRQPEVKLAHAYKDGVEVEFDKYMLPELLNTDNILVSQNGKYVDGKVLLLNEEAAYNDESVTYASKVRFIPTKPFTAKEVTLTVVNHVKSYADVQMQDSYQQTFDIEQELTAIKAESVVEVAYEGSLTLSVEVLPAEASAGKTLQVKSSSPMIASIESENIILDKEGKANIVVTGELPGSASLTYTIDGYDLTAQTIVNVNIVSSETCAMPVANIASGSTVVKGTAVTLSCATEGATIYYTLDGSCPCNETDARKVYDGTPIIINENVTIKAMAMAPDMYESDVAEFSYMVEGSAIDDITVNGEIQIYPRPVRDKVHISADGKLIKSVTISSMNGVVVASSNKVATAVTLDVSKMPTGIYMIKVITEHAIFSRKILKVE